jgi:hypothetical protein
MKYKINYSIGGSLQSNEEIIKKCSLNKIHYQRVKLSKCGADDNFLIGGGNLSKDERSHYVSLCSQLTSRIPDLDYPNITVEIMDYLWKDADDKIDSLGLDAEKTNALKQDVAEIRDNVDNDDVNFIGRINIASLQIIILFTLNEIPIDQPFNESDINKRYPTYQELISMNWKDYNTVKRFITYDTYKTDKDLSTYLKFFGIEEPADIIDWLADWFGIDDIDDFTSSDIKLSDVVDVNIEEMFPNIVKDDDGVNERLLEMKKRLMLLQTGRIMSGGTWVLSLF